MPSDRVRGQLKAILASPSFASAGRTSAFLSFVVEETLAGRAGQIKGAAIARQVLGRTRGFDPSKDPIVSIEARKVRQGLELYYLGAGRGDSVEISLPLGTYLPEFQWRDGGISIDDRLRSRVGQWRPLLAVFPIENRTGDARYDPFCQNLSEELLVGLSRYREFHVRSHLHQRANSLQESPHGLDQPSGLLSGSLQLLGDGIRVGIHLLDAATQVCVWADHFIDADAPGPVEGALMRMGRVMVERIGGEHGAMNRCLVPRIYVQAPPENAESFRAMLLYYHFDRERSSPTLEEAVPLLQQAVSQDPGNGVLKAMLASTRLFTYCMGLTDEVGVLEEALELSSDAVRLESENQFCLEARAWTLFHQGKLDLARVHLERAYALNPNAAYRVALIGWDMMLCGAWQRGREILDSAMKLNPDNPSWLWFVLCFDEFRQKRYGAALEEAERPGLPLVFWAPLMRAAALGKLGRRVEANEAARELVQMRPDFESRGMALIRRLIKDPALEEAIADGLAVGGVTLRVTSSAPGSLNPPPAFVR